MDHAYYEIPHETWRTRLARWLFPSHRRHTTLTPGYADIIFVSSITHFSWPDRLRILWSGVLVVDSSVQTENLPGNTHATTTTYVRSPAWLDQ